MAFPKFIALFFTLAFMAATLQPSEAFRVQGFKPASADQEEAEPAIAANHQVSEPSSKAAAGGGGLPTLPQILGFQLPPLFRFLFPPLPQIPGLPPLFGPLPGATGGPPTPALPHFPQIPGLPNTPPSHPSSATPPPPKECGSPLMGMMPCMGYLTNITVPAPSSACCDGLKSVINTAPICLCHGMNGGMSKLIPTPIDPIRMLILPPRCGTMLPLQTFFACSTQPLPPLMPPSSPVPATSSPVSPPSKPSP